jgi:hypothetical protein
MSPLKRTWTFIWTNLKSLHPRIICIKFDWFWSDVSGEEDFFKMFSVFLFFCYYLPLEKGCPLLLNKFEFCWLKDNLCQVWLKLAQWFWRRFLNDPTPVLHFCLKRTWSFIWTYLNSLHPRIICTKFDSICPAGSRSGEDFSKIFSAFLLFRYYLPLEMDYLLFWTNLNPLHPRMICAKSV